MPKTFSSLSFRSDFQNLPSAFYQQVQPSGLDKPELVIASEACAALVGLDASELGSQHNLALLAGQKILPQWRPIAMKYTGHQFGYYNPDLGDGRGLLLAEIETSSGRLLDLHLKGAGQTPFSRQGDGRAVLRSSIREFLCSEAMAALGVPSSRALCVVNSATPVRREQLESGATLLRVSDSHIRFGHFEFAYRSGHLPLLTALADYVIKRHYPCLAGSANQYADLFLLTAEKTARLIAQWQCLGFAHGVMNTDNMSILGETFDFGPFGFIDRFEPGFICNHSDHEGRYAFDRQPAIAHWNLSVLAQAMSPLVEKDALSEGLAAYGKEFNRAFISGMQAKLGLEEQADEAFIFETLTFIANNNLDYSFFFRQLSDPDLLLQPEKIRDHCLDIKAFDLWLQHYRERIEQSERSAETRSASMRACNPKYVLRNYLAQQAIAQAQQGDYSEVQRLHKVLTQPFDEQTGFDAYAKLPPDWAEGIEVSCSS